MMDVRSQNKQDIDQRYTRCILQRFEDLPDIKSEIQGQISEGYILIGYKGVDMNRASRILANNFNEIGLAGASRCKGFYTTPHFETALDFAKLAARELRSQGDKTLIEPIVPPSDDLGEQKRYRLAQKAFEERVYLFESNEEWKSYSVVLRIYVKDFFNMNGLTLEDQRVPLPDNWEGYNYIEGPMQGGGISDWEIKFNSREEIYSKIRGVQSQELVTCPDLPYGCAKMLEIASRSELMDTITHTAHFADQDMDPAAPAYKRS